jgi:diguanylate cyclase (GGDEF)-like protein
VSTLSAQLLQINNPGPRVRRRGRVLVIVAATSIAAYIVAMFALIALIPAWPLSTVLLTGMCLATTGVIALARAGYVSVSGIALLLIPYVASLGGALANGYTSNAPIFLIAYVLIAGMTLPPRALPIALAGSFLATLYAPLLVSGRTEAVEYTELLTLSTVVASFAALIAGVNNWVMDRSFAEAEYLTTALRQANATLEERVAERTAALTVALRQSESLADQLEELSDRDPLTGLYNRRRLEVEFNRVGWNAHHQEGISVALADLDDFKRINDTLGHHVGDIALQRVGKALSEGCRQRDVVARTGGEEFVLLMPETSPEEAFACSERLRTVVAALSFEDVAPGLRLTVSVGVASSASGSRAAGLPQSLLKQADEMLYAAKRSGKNKVLSCLWTR